MRTSNSLVRAAGLKSKSPALTQTVSSEKVCVTHYECGLWRGLNRFASPWFVQFWFLAFGPMHNEFHQRLLKSKINSLWNLIYQFTISQ
jgi:hypothetical protein